MKTRTAIGFGFGLLPLAVAFFLAKTYWQTPSTDSAWSIDNPEQLLPSPAKGEPLRALFVLWNQSSRPLRILGKSYTC